MERIKDLNYTISNSNNQLPRININVGEDIANKKVVEASITLQPTTFSSANDESFTINFVNSEGEVIWTNVDTITITAEKKTFILNVSDELQYAIDNGLEQVVLQFSTENSSINLQFQKITDKSYDDAIFMSVSEFMKNSAKHSVSLNSAGDLNVNLANGAVCLTRTIMPIKTNALMLNLTHIYTNYFEDLKNKYKLNSNCGKNWKLNIEQYLIEQSHSSGSELIYLNEYGQEERLIEKYYYLDTDDKKVYVNKEDIYYDINGILKYDDKDVYTQCQTNSGLKLITNKQDIKGAEFANLEPEELAQIRDQEESIGSAIQQLEKTISQSEQQLCLLKLSTCTDLSSSVNQTVFIQKLIPTFQSIKDDEGECIFSDEDINSKLIEIFNLLKNEGSTTVNIGTTEAATATKNLQINSYIENLSTYYEQLDNYIIEYEKIAYQLKMYEEQTPQYYLYSNNIIYGFSKLGENNYYTLNYISDYYGNSFVFKHDTENGIVVDSSHTVYNLLYIIDQNENIITFNYKNDLLDNIVDNQTNKYEFKYSTYNEMHTCYKQYKIESRYIYNNNSKLIGIIDKNGMGCLIGYNNEGKKVETLKSFSILDKIEHQKSLFNTELNLINASNIYNITTDDNFIKINYYDYKSTNISLIKVVEEVENGSVNNVEKIYKIVTYIFDKYGNTQTSYVNTFYKEDFDNTMYVQNFDYISDKLTFSSKPYLYSKNFLQEVCFNDYVIVQDDVNYLGDDLILGGSILSSNTPIHTSYHKFTQSATTKKDSVYIPTNIINEISKKISCLTLSGWAKADSAFVINEDDITDKEYSNDIKNRKFEIGAIITYSDEQIVTFKKSFDWMNTEWQFMAVPITIDKTKDISSIQCYIDYSNNTGEILFTDLALNESQYAINEYNEDLLSTSYSSDSNWKKEYEYNDDEQLVKVIYKDMSNEDDSLNEIFDLYEYDANGRLWRTTDYNGIVSEKVFDDNGIEVKLLVYHKDNPAEILYSEQKTDEHGNVTADYNELGEEINTYSYDTKSGNIIISKDFNNIETAYGYSANGSALAQTAINIDGLNNTATYGYTLDFVTKLSHNDFDINYDYDSKARISKISIAGNEYASMEYKDNTTTTKFTQQGQTQTLETILDEDGNLYSTEYNDQTIIRNSYNKQGQILDSSDKLIEEEIEYWYDDHGNLKIIEKNNPETYTKIENTIQNNNITATNIVVAKHDDEIELVEQTLNYTYNYDNTIDKNLTSITLPNGKTQNIYLDKLGRTKQTTNGNFTKHYSYLTKGNHTSNLISNESYGLNGSTLSNVRYMYDKLGNITEIRENGILINRYRYDGLSRLIREDNKLANKTIIYEYDAGGNILSKIEYTYTLSENLDYEQSILIPYAYRSTGWKDQMLSYKGEECEYDEIGNPTTYRNHTLTWNYGRRLMSYDSVNYSYDANGIRRTKEITQQDGTKVKTYFFTNGTQILCQYDGNLMLFYYGVEGVTGFNYDGIEYTYKKNILGDIIGIYDNTGEEIVKYIYEGFGDYSCRILSNNGKYIDIEEIDEYNKISEKLVLENRKFISEINPFRYRGYYYDVETGLYYLNSRYYDPSTGRFINADDISILNTSKEEINGLNLYAYCFNNPINDVDEYGNWSLKKFFKSKVGKILIGVTISVVSAALTVVTAGGFAAAGAALAGVFTGSASGVAGLFASITVGATLSGTIGFFAGGISSAINGEGFWDGAATGFMWGSISGAVSGGFGYLTFGGIGNLINQYTGNIVGNTIQSFVQGFISTGGYVLQSLIEGDQITFTRVALSFGSGFISGLIANVPYQIQLIVSILSELSTIALDLFKIVSKIHKNYII